MGLLAVRNLYLVLKQKSEGFSSLMSCFGVLGCNVILSVRERESVCVCVCVKERGVVCVRERKKRRERVCV